MSYKLAGVIWNDDGTMATKELEALTEIENVLREETSGSSWNMNEFIDPIKKSLKAFEIIKSFGNYEVIEVQGQWYLLQGNSFLKSPKIPITKEQAILLTEVLK